jgi:hypothetical protein
MYTTPRVDLGEGRENALPHTQTQRRRGTFERRRLTEQNGAGRDANLVGPDFKRIRGREKNRKPGADRQSLSMHSDIPRDDEDAIGRARTLSPAA